MQEIFLTVDFNGIVVFDPALLKQYFGNPGAGANLWRRLTTSEDGERVLERGILLPILGIHDAPYRVFIRREDEPSPIPGDLVVVSNGVFALQIAGRACIADMACLLEWDPDDAWETIELEPGYYAATINGYRRVEENAVQDYGFEIVLARCDVLPEVSGSLARDMRVSGLPDKRLPAPPPERMK